MSASEDQTALAALDLQSFAKAWVAQLIELGITGVRPHEATDRHGFDQVIAVLDSSVQGLLGQGVRKSAILPILQIANELRPSAAGDYEGFESALRSLQLTFTSSPNPWYEYIAFPISKTHAESFLEEIPAAIRDITQKAAIAFRSGETLLDVAGTAPQSSGFVA